MKEQHEKEESRNEMAAIGTAIFLGVVLLALIVSVIKNVFIQNQ